MSNRHTAPMPGAFQHGTLHVSEWVLGIVGAIAVFLGVFILVAGDDQYVGLGGEASWRVGDISAAWGYGLLGAGVLFVLLAGAVLRWDRQHGGAEVGAERSSRTDVFLHAVIFVLVNALLWVQDIAIGGGLNYAYWVTIPWGLGLVAHATLALREKGRQTH